MSTDIEKPDVIGATRRAETIRAGMVGYAAAMEAIGEAYEKRDWAALGHKDWDTYCEKEFSEKRLKLTREQREQAVLAFRGAGMSIRAIGSALGVSTTTIQRDLYQSDTPAAVTGADGKTYSATRPTPSVPDGTPDTAAAQSEPLVDPLAAISAAAAAVDAFAANQSTPAVRDPEPSPEGPAVATTGQPEEDPRPAKSGDEDDAATSSDVKPSEPTPSGEGDEAEPEAPTSEPADPRQQETPGVTPPAAASDEDDEEEKAKVHREYRERTSQRFCEALVTLTQGVASGDPLEWLKKVYLPDAYKMADLPGIRKCFTAESIEDLGAKLYGLGKHMRETGRELP
jgi:hypothetical protein